MGSAESPDAEKFRDIGESIAEAQRLLVEIDGLVKRKVLPQQRGRFVMKLREVNTLVEQMRELLERSGMIHRIGFVREGESVQPVMLSPPAESVNDPDATTTEGAGVSGG